MKICEICFVIFSLAEVNPFPAESNPEILVPFENNPNVKLFPAYGGYPSAIEELYRPVKRDSKQAGNENQYLETQESETNPYIIQQVLPKTYRVATVANPPRVITTYYGKPNPIISESYGNQVQEVLIDNDLERSAPFEENGSGTELRAEKAPLKLLVVEDGPVVYETKAINVLDPLSGRQQRAFVGSPIENPFVLRLADKADKDGNSGDTLIKYYDCQTIDTKKPAICSRNVIKTVRTNRQLVLAPSLSATWPKIPEDLSISSVSRTARGGRWRDYVTFSVESNTDPLEDENPEENRISEVKTIFKKAELKNNNINENSNDDAVQPRQKAMKENPISTEFRKYRSNVEQYTRRLNGNEKRQAKYSSARKQEPTFPKKDEE